MVTSVAGSDGSAGSDSPPPKKKKKITQYGLNKTHASDTTNYLFVSVQLILRGQCLFLWESCEYQQSDWVPMYDPT